MAATASSRFICSSPKLNGSICGSTETIGQEIAKLNEDVLGFNLKILLKIHR